MLCLNQCEDSSVPLLIGLTMDNDFTDNVILVEVTELQKMLQMLQKCIQIYNAKKIHKV